MKLINNKTLRSNFLFLFFATKRNINIEKISIGFRDWVVMLDCGFWKKMVVLSICLDPAFVAFCVCALFFFMLQHAFQLDKFHCSCYYSWIVVVYIWLFSPFSSHPWVPCTFHGTYKLHFLATFSLKMGHTVLFTYLKIILL